MISTAKRGKLENVDLPCRGSRPRWSPRGRCLPPTRRAPPGCRWKGWAAPSSCRCYVMCDLVKLVLNVLKKCRCLTFKWTSIALTLSICNIFIPTTCSKWLKKIYWAAAKHFIFDSYFHADSEITFSCKFTLNIKLKEKIRYLYWKYKNK